jgi:hypothetical protein
MAFPLPLVKSFSTFIRFAAVFVKTPYILRGAPAMKGTLEDMPDSNSNFGEVQAEKGCD